SPPEHARDARAIAETLRATAWAIRGYGVDHPGYAGALDVLNALATEPPNAERLESGLLAIYKPRQKLEKLPCADALARGEAALPRRSTRTPAPSSRSVARCSGRSARGAVPAARWGSGT